MNSAWLSQERKDFSYCLCALRKYRAAATQQINYLKKIAVRSDEQIAKLQNAVNLNADLFEFMSEHGPSCFGEEGDGLFEKLDVGFDEGDLIQLDASLHSAARDWTSIGAKERQETYGPVLEALEKYINKDELVLVPGSGLCRLAIEIATAGYRVEANESAFIMLVISYFAMFREEKYTISPFIHQISGLDKFEDCLVNATFPDMNGSLNDPNVTLNPAQLVETGKLELKAGKFEGVYAAPMPKFKAVVTSFFIDVVHNVKLTIARLYKLIVDGGVWINVGPIVNHNPDVGFFAPLTCEDVDIIAKAVGFEIVEQKRIETTYSQNPNSHAINKYNAVFTVYRK